VGWDSGHVFVENRQLILPHRTVDCGRLRSTADDCGHGRLQSTAGGPRRSTKKTASPGLS
jgi:hypothetical protein